MFSIATYPHKKRTQDLSHVLAFIWLYRLLPSVLPYVPLLLQLLRSFTSPFAQEILEILINKNTKGYDLRGIKYNRN